MLTQLEQQDLLALGRQAVEAYLSGHALACPEAHTAFQAPRGAFATWRTADRQLRGCIGFVRPHNPLFETVPRAAIEAAVHDPRFPPVVLQELAALQLELSILSDLVPVHDVSAIEPGVHGLLVELGPERGLLLPQVAREFGWDRGVLLEQVCVKAKLPPAAWRRGARLWSFTAEVFGDDSMPVPPA